MDYRKVTNISSKQYQLIKQLNKCNDGLLRDDDEYIAVALGRIYGNIGDRFVVELDNGKTVRQVKVIKADEKADVDVVDGCYHKVDGSMIEIIVDTKKIKFTYYEAGVMGDFNYSDIFNGYVKNIYKVVEE